MRVRGLIQQIATIREKTHSRMEQYLNDYGLAEIAPSHGSILIALDRVDSLTMGELAQAVDRDKSTLTVLVNRLEQLGYVRRLPDSQDLRITRIALTDRARKARRKFTMVSQRMNREFFAGFEDAELNELRRLLTKLQSNL
ncbi:MAG: MarR family transcriptional regulator [Leptospirales bacterium]|nr:MarR family transcriptional regulator [Leptospirales bacterium]